MKLAKHSFYNTFLHFILWQLMSDLTYVIWHSCQILLCICEMVYREGILSYSSQLPHYRPPYTYNSLPLAFESRQLTPFHFYGWVRGIRGHIPTNCKGIRRGKGVELRTCPTLFPMHVLGSDQSTHLRRCVTFFFNSILESTKPGFKPITCNLLHWHFLDPQIWLLIFKFQISKDSVYWC